MQEAMNLLSILFNLKAHCVTIQKYALARNGILVTLSQ